MVVDESTVRTSFPYADRLQQILNRLYKQYDRLRYEDRHQRIVEDIKEMELSESDRQELLRRLD